MNISSLLNTASNSVQQIISSALQNATSSSSAKSSSIASAASPQDSNQLSPFAQMLNELQNLQQTNPSQYSKVTSQIATNLTTAAQQASSQGNTAEATQLSQLASDFKSSSTSGQLPSIQDLANAIGGGGHHHHHHASSSDSDSSSTTSTSGSTTNTAQSLFGSDSSTSSGQNALSIIMNTLASAQTS
jgi:hypothetical protein